MSKYKIGDKVKVVSNISHHFFNIGDIVALVERLGTDGWDCQNEEKEEWSLSENEFEISIENDLKYPNYQKYVLKEELNEN